MSEILFTSPGQTIDAAMLASGDDDLTLDERIAAIERLNPSLNGKPVTLGQFTPFFIPGLNGTDNKMCGADFGELKGFDKCRLQDAKYRIRHGIKQVCGQSRNRKKGLCIESSARNESRLKRQNKDNQ